LEEQVVREVSTAARDPRDTLRLVVLALLFLAALLTYLLVAAVSGHNPIADRYLSAIGVALAPLVTFGLGVLVPSPYSHP
jgi:hypothetical protein